MSRRDKNPLHNNNALSYDDYFESASNAGKRKIPSTEGYQDEKIFFSVSYSSITYENPLAPEV